MADENSAGYPNQTDYKEISERLRRRLQYRDQQLSALRHTLKSEDGGANMLNESFVSNSAVSDGYPRVVEEIRRSAADLQELNELRLKLKDTSDQLSFQTRRANLLHERLSDLEHRGIVASTHSRASDEEVARLRLRVSELEGERQSLLSQTVGLEQTRLILKKQIEKISDLKSKARTTGSQTDSGLRLSRDELELRVLRSEMENKRSETAAMQLEISTLQNQLANVNAETISLKREQFALTDRLNSDSAHKVAAVKLESMKAHTQLCQSHQDAMQKLRQEHAAAMKTSVTSYEEKLDVAIKLREEAVTQAANCSLAEKCRTLEATLVKISDQHQAELANVVEARNEFESVIREEMAEFEIDMQHERTQFRSQLENVQSEISTLNDRLSTALSMNNQLDDELRQALGSLKCKDERVSELDHLLAVARHETESGRTEQTRLAGLLDFERNQQIEERMAASRAISELEAEISRLKSEISRHDFSLASQERKARLEVDLQCMEMTSLRNLNQQLEDRMKDLNVLLDKERKESSEAATNDRKYLLSVERNTQLVNARVSDLETVLSKKEAELTMTRLEMCQVEEEKDKIQERLDILEAQISGYRGEKEILGSELQEKTSVVQRLTERVRHLEVLQSDIFAKNVRLVESGSSPRQLDQITRQLKLETVALIDHLAHAHHDVEQVERLQTENARLLKSRDELRAGGKDLCDKVGTMTTKYRKTQQELQVCRHEAKMWHDRYLQQLQNINNNN